MARGKVASATPLMPREIQLNLDYCFKPLTIWMKILGIPLFLTHTNVSQLSVLISVFYYLLTTGCNTYYIVIAVPDISGNSTTTSDVNSFIDVINFAFLTTTTHTILLAASYITGKELQTVLHRLVQQHTFHEGDDELYRKIFLIGSAVIAIESAIQLAETITSLVTVIDKSLIRHFVLGLAMVSFIITYVGCVLFSCLGWTAVKLMQMLNRELESKQMEDQDEWLSFLDSFRERYLLVVDTVKQTSRHFGLLLLVVITSEFIRITNISFQLLMEFYNNKMTEMTLLVAFDCIKETGYFCLMVYIPSRIQSEATKLIKKLHAINCDHHSVRTQIHYQTWEMVHSLPKVTAVGWVQVDLKLIPSIFGTALTYLIILCQFYTSESAIKRP